MITESILSIWISPGLTNGETLEAHYNIGNTDVIVCFSDDTKYVASFFTYKNIDRLRKKNQKTGEYLNGKYFWSSDMILIERIDKNSIEEVIHALLKDDSFQHVFKHVV